MDDKFICVVKLYKNDIYRLVYSYVNNTLDTEDLVQNTFIKLYNHQHILEKSDKEIKKWLIKVAINESKTNILSAWKRKVSFFKDNEENNIKTKANSNELFESIMELDKKYRLVLYLYYYEEYKVKEISKILHISETNVQTRLARAREKLKIFLREEL